jgi:hypothetical protein
MCWHKWTKWEQYLWEGEVRTRENPTIAIPSEKHRQKRNCIKCGIEEDVEY